MLSLGVPASVGIWTGNPPGALPFDPYRFKINRGSRFGRGLAFLLLPTPNGIYFDMVRRLPQITKFSGTVTRQAGLYGQAYQFGDPTNASGGTAVSASDPYYVPGVNSGVTTISIACGTYNTATITGNGSTNYVEFTGLWVGDTSTGHSLRLLFQNNGTGMNAVVEAFTATTNTNITATLGAGTNYVTSGEGVTSVGVLNGTALSISAAGSHTQFATGSGTTSGSLSGATGQLQLSSGTAANGNSANRAILWFAGWSRALSAADMAALASTTGGLPPSILVARS